MAVSGLELVNLCENAVPSENFQRENRTTFSEVPLFPEIFQWNEPKNHVPFTTQPEFPESLGKWNANPERWCNSLVTASLRHAAHGSRDSIRPIKSGLEKYLNSTLPVGQVTPKFCLPGALPRLPKFSNSLIIHEPKN